LAGQSVGRLAVYRLIRVGENSLDAAGGKLDATDRKDDEQLVISGVFLANARQN
jgi:hypothetical protein